MDLPVLQAIPNPQPMPVPQARSAVGHLILSINVQALPVLLIMVMAQVFTLIQVVAMAHVQLPQLVVVLIGVLALLPLMEHKLEPVQAAVLQILLLLNHVMSSPVTQLVLLTTLVLPLAVSLHHHLQDLVV